MGSPRGERSETTEKLKYASPDDFIEPEDKVSESL